MQRTGTPSHLFVVDQDDALEFIGLLAMDKGTVSIWIEQVFEREGR
jgi:hypothetical protein